MMGRRVMKKKTIMKLVREMLIKLTTNTITMLIHKIKKLDKMSYNKKKVVTKKTKKMRKIMVMKMVLTN